MQRLLGIINFLKMFIPNLNVLYHHYVSYLKKKIEWLWSNTHNEALGKIKNTICSNEFLAPFDPNFPIVIQCDTSKDAQGGCLFILSQNALYPEV